MRTLILLLAAVLSTVAGAAFAASSTQPVPVKAVAPFQRIASNSLVSYDFMFLPANPGTDTAQASYDSVTRTLVIRFRVRIPGFGESPLRYHLSAIEDYEARLKFFAFEFGRNISLFQDSAACPQAAYAMDANLNAGPFETFIVAYRLPKPLGQTADMLHLQVEDPVLYGGTVDVVIKKDELQ